MHGEGPWRAPMCRRIRLAIIGPVIASALRSTVLIEGRSAIECRRAGFCPMMQLAEGSARSSVVTSPARSAAAPSSRPRGRSPPDKASAMNLLTPLRRLLPASVALALLVPLVGGCQGWEMTYGDSKAQFEAADAMALAREYVGEKVTVRGTVVGVVVSELGSTQATVTLEGGVRAQFGDMVEMAMSCEAGEVVYIDGFVRAVDQSTVTLEPAALRDPTAPFEPIRR